ncbi:MAG: 1,4-dihydroxy-6-naphthoate synthase [Bacteroidota bacterium]
MKISLGFSPCPNDTFIFDALVHQRIDTEGLEFSPVLADVEALNKMAFAGELAVTKLSYHALGHVLDNYALLEAGSALGRNCGPLLIAKRALSQEEVNQAKIAIPGEYTTANFLLSLAYPKAQNKETLLFSEIEEAVLSGQVDAGLIIHENRFTYQDKGLIKVMDCGEYWESNFGHPIPLGGIAVRRDLPNEVQQSINRVLQKSVAYAFAHPKASRTYVQEHAQEMEPEVQQKHIDLYVNDFSKALGTEGRSAISALYQVAQDRGVLKDAGLPIFAPF